MTRRGFIALCIATAVAVGGAIWTVRDRPSAALIDFAGAVAFETLRQDPTRVASIVIADRTGTVTLERRDDRWTVASRHGYPAAAGKIRRLLSELTDMRLVEPKTALPSLYARLELEDPMNDNAKSRALRVLADDDRVVADAIIGRRIWHYTGGKEWGTYIRRPNDERAWLASGNLALETDSKAWLDKKILDVPAEHIRAVTVSPSGTAGYGIARAKAEDGFALADGPVVRAADQAAVERLAAALANVEMIDVAPAEDIAWPASAPRTTFATFAAVDVIVEIATIDGKPWGRFSAVNTGDENAATATNGEELAFDITARVDGWVFELPAEIADRLTPPLESLLQQPGG